MMQTQDVLAGRAGVIVVVEDDAAVRNSLKFSLEVVGFLVCTYARGEELLDQSIISNCHCFVVDEKTKSCPE
jgi:FixJ family two-component response regulator